MTGEPETRSRVKNRRRFLLCLPLLLLACFALYVSSYYRADERALNALRSDETVSVTQTGYGWLFDGPSAEAALIFYPGAKVEETAYAPLLHELAAHGLDVCLVKMPFRLAALNENAADAVIKAHDYETWYIGGHSLGGAVAARYAAAHPGQIEGAVLLAAYATKPLADSQKEIVLVGSEDGVIQWEELEKGRSYAPERYVESVIEGGNHAQFGSYGAQKGDGAAEISADEQVQETLRVVLENLLQAA